MTITVKLIGPLVQALGFSEKTIFFADIPTPDAVLKTIAFPAGRPRIITCNGRAIRPDDPLAEGDRIVISPLYSGG